MGLDTACMQSAAQARLVHSSVSFLRTKTRAWVLWERDHGTAHRNAQPPLAGTGGQEGCLMRSRCKQQREPRQCQIATLATSASNRTELAERNGGCFSNDML